MERVASKPRAGWQKIVESQGFLFHTPDGECYWDESACYRFRTAEVDAIEKATYALNDMCLKAVEHVIDQNLFDRFQIPESFAPFVARSWDQDELTIYGRFDLAYDGTAPPKLVEYNADTPTSLLEASVIQWHWLKDTNAELDQFNSIHERLIEAWGRVKERGEPTLYFTCSPGDIEDWMTLSYLRDTAMQAGLQTRQIDIDRLGFNHRIRQFVDENESPVSDCFKLYPWEWLLREKFAPYLLESATRWLEAPWKMILSNKAILPVLWELFPGNPHLLPASFEPLSGDTRAQALFRPRRSQYSHGRFRRRNARQHRSRKRRPAGSL